MIEESLEKIVNELDELIERDDSRAILGLIEDRHPVEVAEFIDNLAEEKKRYVFRLLHPPMASGVLLEVSDLSRDQLVEEIEASRLAEIVDEMASDDAADIVGELSSERAEEVLDLVGAERADELQQLLRYDEESAGGIMTKQFVSVPEDATVQEAIEQIRATVDQVESVYVIYVVDRRGVLVGILSLAQLVLSRPEEMVSRIMSTDVVSVPTNMDQEEVAALVEKYDLASVPVVDRASRLVGRITVDDVVDVIVEEASEDISKMAGTTDEEIRQDSALRIAGMRLPWIIISLLGGILSGTIISHFRAALGSLLALVFFIPVITAMGGNIGIQSSTIVVRGLATGEIQLFRIAQRLFREARIGLLMGVMCGGIVGLVALVWQGNPLLGVIVGLAMLSAITVAATMGALVPLLFKKINIDPAIATGPFVTMSNDIVGLVIYFGLAAMLLRLLG
ncbi:magnesium transporter [bacterium]|nr:magnesium transporter [bacterium]